MGCYWCRGSQQFLGYNEALEIRALLSAVFSGTGNADPAARAYFPAEFRAEFPMPEMGAKTALPPLAVQKVANLVSQLGDVVWELKR
jgi:hypothetical protein